MSSTTTTAGPLDPVGTDLMATLKALKLGGLKDTLPERLALAKARKMGHAAFLQLVLADEITRRESRSAMLRARTAGLDPTMRLDTWDEPEDLTYDRALVSDLTSLRFTEAGHGVLILGPVGVGKTHLATALGHIGIRRRLSVHASRADKLFTRLRAARLDNSLELHRRELRTAHVLLDQEPRRKGRRGQLEVDAFRTEAGQALERNTAWPKLKAPLAVDFQFVTSQRQPPKLWSLPKHYLDLLGSGSPTAPQQPLLFGDDGQVKMLYVSAHNGWEPDTEGRPWLALSARTRTDAIHVMELADRLSQRRGAPQLGWDDDPARDDRDLQRENRDTAARLEERGDEVSLRTAELIRFQVRRDQQEQFLNGIDEWLTSIFLRDARRLLLGPDRAKAGPCGRWSSAFSEQDQVTFARQSLRGLRPLELPPLPSVRGGSAEFRREIEKICAEFVDARPGLFPLVQPLRVTVLVVPPARHHANTADLDNILIRILSTVDEQMKPPLNPWLTGPPPRRGMILAGEDAQLRHERELARAKSLGQTAIWAYQVLELARTPEDSDAGQVTLVLGHGMNDRSVWEEAARYADDLLERWRQ